MKLHINKGYLILTLIILVTEILIALFIKTGFIRHTFGDFLVVILIYCFFRSFIQVNPYLLAIAVLLFAYTIEILQGFQLLNLLNLENNKLAKIIIGSTFHLTDLVAYTLGCISILIIDIKIKNHD